MHFSKEAQAPPAEYTYSQWHHIGLLGLMEFSDPVDLKSICKRSDWRAVRVQTGLLQGLVRNIAIPTGETYYSEELGEEVPLPLPIAQFYSPEEVSITCSNP